jgi:hypothetical protein
MKSSATVAHWRAAILTLLLVSSPAAGAFAAPARDAYETTRDVKKIAWMDRGMEAIKLKLKDPESAEFRHVYFNRGVNGVPTTCGQVNARNGFGGYSGFQRFVSAGTADLTFLESEVSDFDTVWNQLC